MELGTSQTQARPALAQHNDLFVVEDACNTVTYQ